MNRSSSEDDERIVSTDEDSGESEDYFDIDVTEEDNDIDDVEMSREAALLEETGVELGIQNREDAEERRANEPASENELVPVHTDAYSVRNEIIFHALRGHLGDAIRQLFRSEMITSSVHDNDHEQDPSESRQFRRRAAPTWYHPTDLVPNPRGRELMNSQNFGQVDPIPSSRTADKRYHSCSLNLVDQLSASEGGTCKLAKHAIAKRFRPNSKGKVFERYNSRAYSGQFSLDGSLFYTCLQDFTVHLYDSTDFDNLREYKTLQGTACQWTITDANLSTDNQWIIYSSISSVVNLAKTTPDENVQYALEFNGFRSPGMRDDIRIWSIRFSRDAREIVAGAADQHIMVYDIEHRRIVKEFDGHSDDVNAVCFADQSSNVIYTGSDDSLVKVWDRRALRNVRPSGVFVGHLEGCTFVSAKGDGRYCISNGKDQSMKLWDIRKMMSYEDFGHLTRVDYSSGYDYRYMPYPGSRLPRHPNDCSIVTYRGHHVLKTLIRCHFSPAESTGQRYVYSGSEDGRAHIWDLDGRVIQVLDTASACIEDNDVSSAGRRRALSGSYRSRVCVRDASWHPTRPSLVTTAWTDFHASNGTIVRHDYDENMLHCSEN